MNKIPLALSYDDVLLVPKYSEIESRSEIDLSSKISKNLTIKIPLIPTKMDTITGVEMAIKLGELGSFAILPRFETPELQAEKVYKIAKKVKNVAAAVGAKDGFLERAELLVKAGATIINIDVAHGHMKKTIKATKMIKQKFGDKITLISGITSTYECARDLYKAGADCLLVGVGAGSICTTRIMTGFGVPIITALLNTAKAAKEFNKTFMPDAGTRNSGDIVKALACGACGVVAGNIFAGTKETPGEIIEIKGKKYKAYNGSASKSEKIKQVEKYNKDKNEMYIIHTEGVEGIVPYKGNVEDVIQKLLAGVRSGLAYAGALNIKDFYNKAEFIRITSGGLRESNYHDIIRHTS
ncbi:guanosine monophosphate reductase [candidate division WWE3 bacterium CG10_big_fil_rev_8_21_14_0_10_32_10]|uniref:Guanosine monophosphate reductase n=1 Tax=candidate division WWE3 bacterium CG10_big_fil_rev_8_21_14_0_10_32_10 TaxID=1975090 RepID=A0A2H0RB77_UNCKA|nr:MAG: guanosine monophosphate reductase [candidate division WWE3 bacterium CG10_big_fil_rev_8_21_14_0_10_32_10]